MIIEHIGLWVRDLAAMADFYCAHFGGKAGELYVADHDQFRSLFIEFSCGARLELMTREGLQKGDDAGLRYGWAHLTFSVGTKEKVNGLTAELAAAGCEVMSGPRITGDGYYESMIRDPEGNLLEITL